MGFFKDSEGVRWGRVMRWFVRYVKGTVDRT